MNLLLIGILKDKEKQILRRCKVAMILKTDLLKSLVLKHHARDYTAFTDSFAGTRRNGNPTTSKAAVLRDPEKKGCITGENMINDYALKVGKYTM
jgi:hypothetical protein